MKFLKMHACGNDYVYIFSSADNEKLSTCAKFLSDRHKGIGGDGMIAMSFDNSADARMRIFNSDGSEGDMCGNGVRCAAVFLRDFIGIKKNDFIIKTNSRVVNVSLTDTSDKTTATAELDMPSLFLDPEKLSRALLSTGLKHDKNDLFAVDVGNEHLVFYNARLPADKLSSFAAKCGLFENGINIETAELSTDGVNVSVYERGSGYTLACGSGAIAAAYSAFLKTGRTDWKVNVPGGTLSVDFADKKARLSGEVTKVFGGETDYEL